MEASSTSSKAAAASTGKLTPADHLQRARRVLRERNYNNSGRSATLANRKRSLADRSSPLATKPLLLTKRSTSFKSKPTVAKSECLFRIHSDGGTPMGLSILVGRSSSSIARPSLSPLSISGLSRCDPSPQSQAAATFKSFVSCQEEEEEDDSSPMASSNTTLPEKLSHVQVREQRQPQSPAKADDATHNEAEVTMFFSPASRMSQVPLLQTTKQPSSEKEEEHSVSMESTTRGLVGTGSSVVAVEKNRDHGDPSTSLTLKEQCLEQADREDAVVPVAKPPIDEHQPSKVMKNQHTNSKSASENEHQSVPPQVQDDSSSATPKELLSPGAHADFSANDNEQRSPFQMDCIGIFTLMVNDQQAHEGHNSSSPLGDGQESLQDQEMDHGITSSPSPGKQQSSPPQIEIVNASSSSLDEHRSQHEDSNLVGTTSLGVDEQRSPHQLMDMELNITSRPSVDEDQMIPQQMDHASTESPSGDDQRSLQQRMDHLRATLSPDQGVGHDSTSSPSIDEQQSSHQQMDHSSTGSPSASIDEQQSPHQLCFFFDDESTVAEGKSKLGARKSSLPTVPERDTASKFFFFEDMSPVSEPRGRRSSFAVPQRRTTRENADDEAPQQQQLLSGSKPIFSFEDDSLGATSTEELLPRRRRTDSRFLLLPTPSPYDPVSVDSLQPSPTSAFSKVAASPAPEMDETLLDESLLQLSPTSAFSKVISPRKVSLLERSSAVDESMLTSSAMLTTRASIERGSLVVPGDAEANRSIAITSLLLSPTSVFSQVPPSQETLTPEDSIVEDTGELRVCDSTSHASAPSTLHSDDVDFPEPLLRKDASQASAPSLLNDESVVNETVVEEELSTCQDNEQTMDDDDENDVVPLLLDPVVVDGKHILEPVDDTPTSQRSTHMPLKSKYRAVLVENTTLHNRLSNIRKDYEERVTPFRDVFEDERKLRIQNKQLKAANDKIQAQNQQLRKQKEEVDTMVAQLQTQMMTSLQAAIQNSNQLKQALAKANEKIESLEEELLEATEK